MSAPRFLSHAIEALFWVLGYIWLEEGLTAWSGQKWIAESLLKGAFLIYLAVLIDRGRDSYDRKKQEASRLEPPPDPTAMPAKPGPRPWQ